MLLVLVKVLNATIEHPDRNVTQVSCLLFPLTCAWALTCHRFQSQTVDHLWQHAQQSSLHPAIIVNKQYYYVALNQRSHYAPPERPTSSSSTLQQHACT